MHPSIIGFVTLFLITCEGAGGLRATELRISPPIVQRGSEARLACAGGLRATELRISPPIVQRGSDARLACLYELHDAPLYSVKWYRGRHEFYRYSPTEMPDTKIFPFAGINVDLARSNESQVVLTRVSFGLSGNFSCEVTADAPSFSTSSVSAHMDVVALPNEGPSISTEHVRYAPGVLLRATCRAPPSRPATTLLFTLNDEVVTSSQLRTRQASEGLVGSEVSVSVPLAPAHFERGAALLSCEASVAGTSYRETAELLLQPTSGHPRIERVTSSGTGSALLRTYRAPSARLSLAIALLSTLLQSFVICTRI